MWRSSSASTLKKAGESRFGIGCSCSTRQLEHEKGRELVLLLLGGDKGSQKKDISRAQDFWSRYVKESKNDKAK